MAWYLQSKVRGKERFYYRMKKILLITTLMFFSFTSFRSANANTTEQTIMEKLSGEYGFEFKFEQKNFYKFLTQPRITVGKAVYGTPSSFIWELFGDNAVKIVSDGKKIWIYSPAEEAGDKPTLAVRNAQTNDGIQSLILGNKYKITDLKPSKSKKDIKEVYITGSKDSEYHWAIVRVDDRKDFSLDSIEFEDKDGSKVLIEVKAFKRLAQKAPQGTFVFKAPKGTRIIK
jgi:outer membrane lipoprotein-sorting protein